MIVAENKSAEFDRRLRTEARLALASVIDALVCTCVAKKGHVVRSPAPIAVDRRSSAKKSVHVWRLRLWRPNGALDLKGDRNSASAQVSVMGIGRRRSSVHSNGRTRTICCHRHGPAFSRALVLPPSRTRRVSSNMILSADERSLIA